MARLTYRKSSCRFHESVEFLQAMQGQAGGHKNSKIIVIGAGPAGLSAAVSLAKKGFQPEVYEASPYVGGLARSFELWDQTVDVGPHRFFSNDKRINEHWLSFVKDDFTWVDRTTRIFYRNRFFYYPLQITNVLKNLSIKDLSSAIFSYLLQKLRPIATPKTFEEWVTNRFGKKLFSIFFKTYSEKVWGIPCSKIDANWAAQRIKKLSLWEAVLGAFKFRRRKTKHATLVDQFMYPKGGSGVVYRRMVAEIERLGGKVYLSTPVKQVVRKADGKVSGVVLENGQSLDADVVISTMPLTLMAQRLNSIPEAVREACKQLYYRNTILVYLEADSPELFPDQWIYVHSAEVEHGRITNFRNWCPTLYGEKKSSILCLEFWCFDSDKLWTQPDAEISEKATQEVRKIGLVPESVKITNAHVMRIPKSYPVYETGYEAPLIYIQNYLDTIENLYPIGRYGAFKYNNQDHSILMGLLVAEEISTGKKQNLWDVNSDSEYQEAAKVADLIPNKASVPVNAT